MHLDHPHHRAFCSTWPRISGTIGLFAVLLLCVAFRLTAADAPEIPAWEYPGATPTEPNHKQTAPPADFHRASVNFDKPVGVFSGQSDIGGPFVPGTTTFDAAKRQYAITSAGYNVWYTRDEFHCAWQKMSGDASLAADVTLVNSNNFGDCKAVLFIRQDLDDGSAEAVVGLHGAGMIQLGLRPEKNKRIRDMEYRIGSRGPNISNPDSLVTINATRVGLEKHGDEFALYVSLAGEPMHQWGPPVTLHMNGPFYVGLGFCSHQPDKPDTAIFSNVALENSSGKIK